MDISVEQLDVLDFLVTLNDGSGPSQHTVIASERDHEELAPDSTLEDLVVEAMRFLLEREPRSMIKPHFTLEEVARMFPDFQFEMTRRFAA